MLGVERGIFARDLGSNVTLMTATFNAGPEEVTALLSGALDAGSVGPNPAINAWQKSHGTAIRIVAGSITSARQLKGKKLASPQLGNTQDVVLRTWLKRQGLSTTTGGRDVSVVPQDDATRRRCGRAAATSRRCTRSPIGPRC